MWLSDFIRRNSLTFVLREVSPDDAERWVMQVATRELVDELYGFGARVVDEAVSTTEKLDAKATSLLGWTVAGLAFLLVASRDSIRSGDGFLSALTAVAVLLAVSASFQAAFALRVRDWEVPSEVDWFQAELFSEPVKLRVFYIMSMLETHQNHNRQNKLKGEHVRRSQWLLIGATVLIGVLIVLK